MKRKYFILIPVILFYASINASAGVTNIKEVLNETGISVEVRKYDTKPLAAGSEFETTKEIPANGGTWSGDMWIPWVDNSDQFIEKRLEVVIGGKTVFWIWQCGDFIRYNSRARFVINAPKVAGESRSGGERRLIISMNGKRPVFEFERY